MWPIVQRVVVPALAVLVGIAAVVYGTMYHEVPLAQKEIEQKEVGKEFTETIRFPRVFGSQPGPWGPPAPEEAQDPSGEPAPPEGLPVPDGGDNPAPGPEFGPQFDEQKVTVTKTVLEDVVVTKVQNVLEPALIFEVTIGGVVLKSDEGPDGQPMHGLWRTYNPGAGEPPPSLCPT